MASLLERRTLFIGGRTINPYKRKLLMKAEDANFLTRLRWSLPWVVRYPFWAMEARLRQISNTGMPRHLILVVANHFEPSWNAQRLDLDRATQQGRLDDWCKQ